MLAREIGIDLGSANTVVAVKRRGIVVIEPSVVAVDRRSQTVIAVGTEAHNMVGKTPDTIQPIRPVMAGVISDLANCTALLKSLISRVSGGGRWLRPKVVLTVAANASKVDRRALAEAATQAGAGEVFLLEKPLASALGAGVPVTSPMGSLLVDVGSGSTSVSVLSLGGIVVTETTDAGGAIMDEAIARHIKKEHNLLIGQPTAERLKIQYGSAIPGASGTVTVVGRLLTTGIPAAVPIEIEGIHAAISDILAQIDGLVLSVLERTPPELLRDISQTGLTLTGGVAMLRGLDQRLEHLTGLPVHVAEAPMEVAALGTSVVLEQHPRVMLHPMKG